MNSFEQRLRATGLPLIRFGCVLYGAPADVAPGRLAELTKPGAEFRELLANAPAWMVEKLNREVLTRQEPQREDSHETDSRKNRALLRPGTNDIAAGGDHHGSVQ